MDLPARSLGRIHAVHAVALCLHELGLTDAEIAARLELPTESIATLLQVAAAKLARARTDETNSESDETHG